MIVTHVLIDGQLDARLFTEMHHLLRFPITRRQRLLCQDAPDVAGLLDRFTDNRQLVLRRNGNIHHLDGGIRQQFLGGVVNLGNAARLSHVAGLVGTAGGNCHHVVTRIAVRHEMAVAHDEAGSDGANGVIFLFCRWGDSF